MSALNRPKWKPPGSSGRPRSRTSGTASRTDELAGRRNGGILFTTLQKFGRTKEERESGRPHPLLSDRRNIIVIVDEAQELSEMAWRMLMRRCPARSMTLVGDVAQVGYGTMVGEYDRYNQQRMITITANIEGGDLGQAATAVNAAIKRAGDAPKAARVDVRGQVPQMEATRSGLQLGLLIAVVAIVLLLTAFFQSPRVSLVVLSTIPAVLAGVVIALWITRTTLNVQSFMGAIMAIGVSVANAILLITFAESARAKGLNASEAALSAASSRLRPILMTSLAMIAGMIPIALALGEGGEQTAPLGRSVIGGLAASTIAVLTVLPLTFAIVQRRASQGSVSVHPEDQVAQHSGEDQSLNTA